MAEVRDGLDADLVHHPAVQRAVRAVAKRVHARARARARVHDESGEFSASLTVEQDGPDTLVASSDPEALHKEFGYTAEDGSRVPGLHVLGGAAADVAGG